MLIARILNQTVLFLNVDWPQHIINTFVLLFSPPWRWPHG